MDIKKVAVIVSVVVGPRIGQIVAQAGYDIILRTRKRSEGLAIVCGTIERALSVTGKNGSEGYLGESGQRYLNR